MRSSSSSRRRDLGDRHHRQRQGVCPRADIGAMAEWGYQKVYRDNYITKDWEHVRYVRKPVIAAVAGYALGGGCELAMACDMIIAADTASSASPRSRSARCRDGGTQRLPRAVGKAKGDGLVLTGRMIDAAKAERSGLVAPGRGGRQGGSEALAVAAKDRELLAARRAQDQGGDQPRLRIVDWPRACCSSGREFTRLSRSKIRRRECARSSRSANPRSSTSEATDGRIPK
jgi:hypothetical protein